jgi:hypothetical protein
LKGKSDSAGAGWWACAGSWLDEGDTPVRPRERKMASLPGTTGARKDARDLGNKLSKKFSTIPAAGALLETKYTFGVEDVENLYGFCNGDGQ